MLDFFKDAVQQNEKRKSKLQVLILHVYYIKESGYFIKISLLKKFMEGYKWKLLTMFHWAEKLKRAGKRNRLHRKDWRKMLD